MQLKNPLKQLRLRRFFTKKLDASKKTQELAQRQKKIDEHKPRVLLEKKKLPKLIRKKRKNRHLLRSFLDRAGYEGIDEGVIVRNVFRTVIIICLVASASVLAYASYVQSGITTSLIAVAAVWTALFAAILIFTWVAIYVFLDLKVFNRTKAVEDVLPDYLQLASANISAGMPVDQALWSAVRPRFGILAKEIEEVAKNTYSGVDLKVALEKFSSRYESKVLKRSVNLLIEGMDSGGQMAGLLNKIAINIQETKLLKQEMGASVMTYAIFIGFASVVAAPILYALSGQLLVIIQSIMAMMAENTPEGGSGAGLSLPIDSAQNAISQGDFLAFSIITLFFTSLFSSMIIAVIRKGSIKESIRIVPVMVIITIVFFFAANALLKSVLGGIMDF